MSGKTRVSIFTRNIAVFVFGAIIPFMAMLQAQFGLSALAADMAQPDVNADASQVIRSLREAGADANDYALFAMMHAEGANQKTMLNKQIMKVSIMQIGFAVSSLGLMLVILGFRDGGAEGSGELSGLKFDFKSGSTGVVVFVVGALMSTAGGVLRNEYSTVPIPGFRSVAPARADETVAVFRECRKFPDDDAVKACLVTVLKRYD